MENIIHSAIGKKTNDTELNHLRKLSSFQKIFLNKFFWIISITFFFSYPIIKSVNRKLPETLPIIGLMPQFTYNHQNVFTQENLSPISSDTLRGNIFLIHLWDPFCSDTLCLNYNKTLQTIQHRLRGVKDRARLISFAQSLPNKDQADELKINEFFWYLGNIGSQTENFIQLFKNYSLKNHLLPQGDLQKSESQQTINSQFILVDQEGRIRASYQSEKKNINQMMIDIGLLINREKNDTKNHSRSLK